MNQWYAEISAVLHMADFTTDYIRELNNSCKPIISHWIVPYDKENHYVHDITLLVEIIDFHHTFESFNLLSSDIRKARRGITKHSFCILY